MYISDGFTFVTCLLLVVELFMNKKLKILVKIIFCLHLREIALLERPQYYCFHFSIQFSIHGRFDCMENLSPIPPLSVNILCSSNLISAGYKHLFIVIHTCTVNAVSKWSFSDLKNLDWLLVILDSDS